MPKFKGLVEEIESAKKEMERVRVGRERGELEERRATEARVCKKYRPFQKVVSSVEGG